MAVVFGVIFLEDGTARNHSIVMDKNGHILADYAKIHPFSYGAEAKYYSGGDALTFCQVDGVPLSPLYAMTCVSRKSFRQLPKRALL